MMRARWRCRFDVGSNITFRSLGDVVARKANIHVRCHFHCDNESIISGEPLYRWYMVHRWDSGLAQIGKHMRCSKCFARPGHTSVTFHTAYGPSQGRWPRSEEAWAALVKALRNR